MSQHCLQREIPSFIDSDLARQRTNNYLQNKQPVLTAWINEPGKEESAGLPISADLFYQLTAALKKESNGNAVSGVRIYFASYIADGNGTDKYIPAGQEKLLTLIFVPTYQPGTNVNDQVNFDDFYIIDYNSSAVVNLKDSGVTNIDSFSWVTIFQTREIPVLQHAPQYPPVSETKTIWFAITDFIDWCDEADCLDKAGTAVSSIYFAYAAYGPDEQFTYTVDGKQYTSSIANQLSLVIAIYPGDLGYGHIGVSDGGTGGNYNAGTPCPPAKCA